MTLSDYELRRRAYIEKVRRLYVDSDLMKVIREIRKKLRQDWDRVIAITGYEGTGKSTLALYLAYLIDDSFDIYTNLSLIPDASEIKKKFKKVEQYGCYVIDEAVKSLHKHDWHNKLQQTLVKMYATERRQNKCTIMLMPRFLDFTENFRNHRIKLWFHVFHRDMARKRATAVLYVKDDRDKDSPDPWHMKENYKLKQKLWKGQSITDISLDQILRAEQKTKCYLIDFEFPPLPDDIGDIYKELKRQAGEANFSDEDAHDKMIQLQKERDALWKARVVQGVSKLHKGTKPMTFQSIAKLMKVSPRALNQWRRDTQKHEHYKNWNRGSESNHTKEYFEVDDLFDDTPSFVKEHKDEPPQRAEGDKES